jgi:glutamine amidotransferase
MRHPKVTVIDYGVGNLLSVVRALEYCGADVTLTADPKIAMRAERILLPGVGAFSSAMQALMVQNLVPVIKEHGSRGTPLLGICLGMQMLFERSEEFGTTEGLGLIPGQVVPVPATTVLGERQKIPHIGWNELTLSSNHRCWRDTILKNCIVGEAAYFVHSFMAMPQDSAYRLADSLYGGHRVAAVVAKDQITGCQFHPEKSGEIGLKILKRFIYQ